MRDARPQEQTNENERLVHSEGSHIQSQQKVKLGLSGISPSTTQSNIFMIIYIFYQK